VDEWWRICVLGFLFGIAVLICFLSIYHDNIYGFWPI
jgi:hypothetical protein